MNSNRVVDDKRRAVLFRADTLQEVADWMIDRADVLDWTETFAEEVDEEENVLGWWSLADLLQAIGKE